MLKYILIAVIVVAAITGVVLYFFTSQSAPSTQQPTIQTQTIQTQSESTTTTTTINTTTTASKVVTVKYSTNGFSPKTVTISTGDKVTFVATSGSGEMWIASNQHPTHQEYDATTKDQHCAAGYSGPAPFDECSAGIIFTFAFQKSGIWEYHSHRNPSNGGTVIVK